ncbi:hypothetical protein A7982_12690 [Minicystis rosea]|nr:hypothetical protein A7982_12690 [Minicystis rosea]
MSGGAVRVELDGAVILEQPAALMLRYSVARGRMVLAVGAEALGLEADGFRGSDIEKATDDADRFARIVPPDAAPWWRRDVRPGSFDPWDHNGEHVVVRPFERETWSPELADAVLRYLRIAALYGKGAPRMSGLARWWLAGGTRTEVRLDVPPPTVALRDAFVRELATANMRLEGASVPPAPLTPWSDISWQQWAMVGGAAVGMPCLRWLLRHLQQGPAAFVLRLEAIVAVASLGVAAQLLWLVRRNGSADPFSRAAIAERAVLWSKLRRFEATPADQDADARTFGLGAQGGLQAVPVACLMVLSLLASRGSSSLEHAAHRLSLPVTVLLPLAMIAILVGAGRLGEWLAGARLAIGARGVTLRRAGLFRRPLFIPAAEMQSAWARYPQRHGRGPHEISILLRGGDVLTFQMTSPFARSQKRVCAVEEALLALIGTPRPYRTAAGSR